MKLGVIKEVMATDRQEDGKYAVFDCRQQSGTSAETFSPTSSGPIV